jgi:TorA maturation chaperone TorD
MKQQEYKLIIIDLVIIGEKNMCEIWKIRKIFYKFLASFYLLPPQEAFLLFPPDLLAEPPLQLSEQSADGWRSLRNYAGDRSGKELQYDQELALEYFRLFVGPDTVLAPPWETVYRHEDRLLFGQETAVIRAWYARYELVSRWLNREPDDHLGLELEFLSFLSQRTEGLLREGNQEAAASVLADQQQFLHKHLLAWVPLWRADVCRHAGLEFYKGLAVLTEGFLRQDADFLQKCIDISGDKGE